MYAIPEAEVKLYGATDRRRVVIFSDTTPSEMPLDGNNVRGLDDDAAIARGSILFVVSTNKKYVMDEDEEGWSECGAGDPEPSEENNEPSEEPEPASDTPGE